MSAMWGEFVGTAILIALGGGVCANVSLSKTKGEDSGWIVISAGWAFAVAIAVYCVDSISGAHLNPAVTLGLAAIGRFDLANIPSYLLAQVAGAFAGAVLVWMAYWPHWQATESPQAKLGVFCTGPAIRNLPMNMISEAIATMIFVIAILAIRSPQTMMPESGLNEGLAPLLVGVTVWSIGLSLGGTTGYAINPARDFGPRLAHFLLPIAGKGDSDWSYAWVPILGPIIGGIVGALLYNNLWPQITP